MDNQPNRLSQFWNELKRRNVIRVITVYAATAFVILELVDILAPSLGLPQWTLNLVLIILVVGLVIAIIVSWIYDIHPQDGVVKTKSIEKADEADAPGFSNRWKIASIISFIVIIGLIFLHIFPRSGKQINLEKSIAVLPFINDSPQEEGMYFLNGSMESILDNLSRIQDLRVVSRTSVEQYRNNPKPIPEIAEEMNVAYVLEGSGLKHGERIRLTLQLIDAAHDTHVWSNSYDRKEGEVFELYSEVAQIVASEIEAVITPDEKERIEKSPTGNTTAYDLYQKALEVDWDQKMELLYLALEYDSTFVDPYIELGYRYIDRYDFNAELYPGYLDSAAIMASKALHFDPQSARANSLQGYVLRMKGNVDDALKAFDLALQFNPNLAEAYNGKGWIYFGQLDYVNALNNFYQNSLRDRRVDNLIQNYDNIGFVLAGVGISENAMLYYEKSLQYSEDTIWYYIRKAQMEYYSGRFQEAIETARKGYEKRLVAMIDNQITKHLFGFSVLGSSCLFAGQFNESFRYFNKYVEIADSIGWSMPWTKMEIAFIFLQNGLEVRARELINQQIRQSEKAINDQIYSNDQYRYLAMTYMLKQDKEKALKYLRIMSQEDRMGVEAILIPVNPIYHDIREDPQFIEICDALRTKYLIEQGRVKQWLEENKIPD